MTIAFSCPDCEKTFKVPDAMAGRKAKCSGCGATILIANVIGLTEKPTAKIRSKAAIVRDDDDYQEEDAAPRKGRSRRDDVEDVDDELDDADEEPTRRSRKRRGKSKKKKKSSAMLLALLAVGGVTLLVLAGAGGGLAWYFWPSSVDPAKFAPDNCKIVMVMNMEQLEGTPAYDAVERESSKLNNQMFAGNNGSLKKSRVAQVQIFSAASTGFAGGPNPIGGNPLANEQTVVVVKTKDTISVDDLRNDPTLKGPFTDTNVNGYTLYEGTPISFCRLNRRQVLLGPSGSLRAVLNRDKKPEFSDNLKAAIDKADFTKPIAMAIDASELPKAGGPKQGGRRCDGNAVGRRPGCLRAGHQPDDYRAVAHRSGSAGNQEAGRRLGDRSQADAWPETARGRTENDGCGFDVHRGDDDQDRRLCPDDQAGQGQPV
jgi:hypothetical protein